MSENGIPEVARIFCQTTEERWRRIQRVATRMGWTKRRVIEEAFDYWYRERIMDTVPVEEPKRFRRRAAKRR